jgi:hypothetical protein
MGRRQCCKGYRQIRFEALLDRHERGKLSQQEAAEMLGITDVTDVINEAGTQAEEVPPCTILPRPLPQLGGLFYRAIPRSSESSRFRWV